MIVVECYVCHRTCNKEGVLKSGGVSHGLCGRCSYLNYKEVYLADDAGKQELIDMIKKDRANVWQGEDRVHSYEEIAEFQNFCTENIVEKRIDRR